MSNQHYNPMIENNSIILKSLQEVIKETFNLSESVSLYLARTVYDNILDSIAKFAKGQLEHGGEITDRNCIRELRNELIDATHYLNAIEEKKKKIVDELTEFQNGVNQMTHVIPQPFLNRFADIINKLIDL